MRFKYYLRGCGLGILLATVILMIGFHRSGGGRLSDEQIMQRASELGMVTPAEVEQLPAGTQPGDTEAMGVHNPNEAQESGGKQEDSQESGGKQNDSQKSDKKQNDSQEDDGEQGDSRSDAGEQTGSDKPDDQNEPDDRNKPDEPETVKVVVRRGEVCRELAEELYELGLVEDAETFRKFMQENGYDNLIRVGEFELTVGMEQEEIAKILTTKPE